jgi:hypothetical protein
MQIFSMIAQRSIAIRITYWLTSFELLHRYGAMLTITNIKISAVFFIFFSMALGIQFVFHLCAVIATRTFWNTPVFPRGSEYFFA